MRLNNTDIWKTDTWKTKEETERQHSVDKAFSTHVFCAAHVVFFCNTVTVYDEKYVIPKNRETVVLSSCLV
jgi:hypothetical protein